MRTALLLTFVLLFSVTMAFAQAGSIGIFSDQTGTSCNLTATPGFVFYYFLHVNTTGATGSDWAAPHPTCLPAVYIGMNVPSGSFYVGNTETGISIGYSAGCHVGTYLIVSSLYNVLGPATDCCRWSVGPHPRFPTIYGSDCHFDRTYPSGGEGIINPTPTCNCDVIVPTEDTTWGRVKALYAE